MESAKKKLTTDDVAEVPGLDCRVYHVNPVEEVPDWRQNLHDGEDDPDNPSEEQIREAVEMVGFDFTDKEEGEEENA